MKVRHSIDTDNDKWPSDCESWIDYWKQRSKNPLPEACPQCNEPSDDFVGAHVEDESGKQYILPVCNSCNSSAKRASSIGEGFRTLLEYISNKKNQNNFFEVDIKLLVKLE